MRVCNDRLTKELSWKKDVVFDDCRREGLRRREERKEEKGKKGRRRVEKARPDYYLVAMTDEGIG